MNLHDYSTVPYVQIRFITEYDTVLYIHDTFFKFFNLNLNPV